MPFLDTVRAQIGNDTYSRLEREAEKEVALAKQMPLRDEYGQESYYGQRFLLGDLLGDCEHFQKLGLRILPTDVVTILFRCKLLFATNTDDEYAHRAGGAFPLGGSSLVVRQPLRVCTAATASPPPCRSTVRMSYYDVCGVCGQVSCPVGFALKRICYLRSNAGSEIYLVVSQIPADHYRRD